MVWEDAQGSVEALAEGLSRIGYSVKLAHSAGGTLRQLRHTFLVVNLGGSRSLLVDPAFRDQFALPAPTPRFAHVLAAVPGLACASRHRLTHAALLLSEEVGRVFEAAEMPLPPWRQAESLMSKWEAAEEVMVASPASTATSSPGSSPDSATGAWLPAAIRAAPGGRVMHKAAPPEAAAAVRRAKDLVRVQERLVCLGLADYQKQAAGEAEGPSPVSVLAPLVSPACPPGH